MTRVYPDERLVPIEGEATSRWDTPDAWDEDSKTVARPGHVAPLRRRHSAPAPEPVTDRIAPLPPSSEPVTDRIAPLQPRPPVLPSSARGITPAQGVAPTSQDLQEERTQPRGLPFPVVDDGAEPTETQVELASMAHGSSELEVTRAAPGGIYASELGYGVPPTQPLVRQSARYASPEVARSAHGLLGGPATPQPSDYALPAEAPYTPLPDGSHFGEQTSCLIPGFELGNYIIGRCLATGGMGVVYEAEHAYLKRKVAVKVLRRAGQAKPDVVRRFFQEALAVTKIGHPGVVAVLDCGHAPDGAAYLVMELLSGSSLAGRLERGRLAVPEAIRIGRAIADTMAAAHAAGIVHRDLKPDNVFMVGPDGPEAQVKVLDFGVAKFLQQSDSDRTKYGMLLGTPFYMSPEQCEGKLEVDHRSDIYSLGCLMFQLLAARCPFPGHAVEVLTAHRHTEPPSIRQFNPEVPPELDALVRRMLAKLPAQRPQSMEDVVEELAEIAPGPTPDGARAAARLPALAKETSSAQPRAGWRLAATMTKSREQAGYEPPVGRRRWALPLALALLIATVTGAYYAYASGLIRF